MEDWGTMCWIDWIPSWFFVGPIALCKTPGCFIPVILHKLDLRCTPGEYYHVGHFLLKLKTPYERESIEKTLKSMPRCHVKQLWFRLLLAGILLIGGVCGSILATSSLGQAVGNSLIQLKIFISGLWGICYYRETKDRQSTINWFLSATICEASILSLSYEKTKLPQEEGE